MCLFKLMAHTHITFSDENNFAKWSNETITKWNWRLDELHILCNGTYSFAQPQHRNTKTAYMEFWIASNRFWCFYVDNFGIKCILYSFCWSNKHSADLMINQQLFVQTLFPLKQTVFRNGLNIFIINYLHVFLMNDGIMLRAFWWA